MKKKRSKNVMKYESFYGVCWHNYFWMVFQMWDFLDGCIVKMDDYNKFAKYHLM